MGLTQERAWEPQEGAPFDWGYQPGARRLSLNTSPSPRD
jgi:hypothetical protein